MNQSPAATPNAAAATVAHDTHVAKRFEQQARRRPDVIALTCGSAQLSYAELDRRANQVANHLLGLGVKADTVVGLCLARSLEMIVGMLGILKAGATYLPLDLVYPKERLAFMLGDAAAAVVLTLAGDRAAIPATAARVVCLDSEWPQIAAAGDAATGIVTDPQSLAYVIYTSGSTGQPKGCQVTHQNLAWFFEAIEHKADFGCDDVWAFFHSHAFDVSGFEIWGALVHGARLVVVPHHTRRSPAAFRQLLLDERVSILCPTPTVFLQLMRADEAAAVKSDYALRHVILGGEALELQALRPWFQRYGDQRPRLANMYGPTETTIYVSYREITLADLDQGAGSVIGTALPGASLRVLDEHLQPVPLGTEGELCIGGAGVTPGYLNRPDLTAQRFIQWCDPDDDSAPTQRLYRSGDRARRLPDGDLEYLGRSDQQVKIRGFRVELGEIEATLTRHPAVRACAVLARQDRPGEQRLVAYVVPRENPPSASALRAHLAAQLPEYMVPAAYVWMDGLPINQNGKLDRHALPPPDRRRPELSCAHEPAIGATEQRVCAAFSDLLAIDGVGRHDNFFELGGDSVLAVRLLERIDPPRPDDVRGAAARLPVTIVFQHPTPAALAAALTGASDEDASWARLPRAHRAASPVHRIDDPIAIVAMAGRFPGAGTVEEFWQNLCDGRDTITRFRPDQLDPAISLSTRNDPAYVAARGVIDGVEDFDAAFFGISHKEAEFTDPQHRVFLELCWECLERAGHVPDATDAPVGVFAGMYDGTYFQRHVMSRPELIEQAGAMAVSFLNEKDYLATRVAHKLNLTGPAISVQTACSTSLVAICQAVDSLRAGHCDMALAGGASVTCPPRSGYLYEQGAIFSVDGCTRAFDSRANGTVFSDGATVVLLKRLADAVADGNPVYAVIRGGAINNDGGAKASFTAPSSRGQAAVIAMAHRNAGVEPRSISYVEAHGTGTPVGDPIELEGLTSAFRRGTADTGFCRIGSVKSNIGHLVIAAGGAGLIKTALALAERKIPASLHFDAPNPTIDFAGSPFVVNACLSDWNGDGAPRRAGVSSFGIGGTNAHVVLEEAPALPGSDPASGAQMLTLSARTPAALAQACTQLADHLVARPDANLADVAWTLAVGRKAFAYRLALVADDLPAAVSALRSSVGAAARTRPARRADPVFLFPGQGATYAGMGRGLYADEPVFRAVIDECARHLDECRLPGEPGFELRDALFSDAPEALLPTSVMQPATFAIEYALARWWMSFGLRPAAMIGHSVGEFVAATLAGVFTLPDALRLVAARGALMQAQPPGGMLAVRLPWDELCKRLPGELSLAAENAPAACVVAGAPDAIARFEARLKHDGVACRALRTSHAFHSPMMEPVVAPFLAELGKLRLSAPMLPLVSTATGDWLDAATATSPEYWARHLRVPVRFAAALGRVLAEPAQVLLEVGPRGSLSALARQHPGMGEHQTVAVASLDDAPGSESTAVRMAAGQLWSHGVALDPALFDRRQRRLRVRLPTYPFQRQRYWIDAPAAVSMVPVAATLRGPATPVTAGAMDLAEVGDLRAADVGEVAATSATAVVGSEAAHDAIDPRVRYLAGVWSDMLGGPVTPDDNFFELGGHSMLAVQMVNRVDRDTGVRIKLIRLGAENVAQIAATLPEAIVAAPAPTAAPRTNGLGRRLKRILGLAATEPLQ